jgi:hypothetical protein
MDTEIIHGFAFADSTTQSLCSSAHEAGDADRVNQTIGLLALIGWYVTPLDQTLASDS